MSPGHGTLPATILVAVLALVHGQAGAQPDQLDFFGASLEELATITVESASRHEESLMEAPAAVSVITREEIVHSAAHTIPEILQYVVGLDGYTKTRTDMDVAARGNAYDETAKMLVLIDGQPVNVAPYSGVQWPTLPLHLEDIQRIEVVRGAASAVYGADAVAGVINIMTLPADQRSDHATVLVGEDGLQRITAGAATDLGERWQLAVSAGYWQTEDDEHDEREQRPGVLGNWSLKDHAEIWTVGYRLDHQGENLRLTSQAGFSTDEEGYNPSPGDLVVDRATKHTFWISNLVERDLGANCLSLRFGARNLWQRNEAYRDDTYVFKYTLDRGLGLDADLHYRVETLPHQTLIVGANLSHVGASRNIANQPPYEYDETETLVAAYLQDQIRLADDRLLLTLSGRFDKWTNLDAQFSPRAAVNYALVPGKLSLRAIAGTSFRRPSFDENFYFVRWPGGWFKGSAVEAVTEDGQVIAGRFLEPERLTDVEVGVRLQPDERLQLDLGAFRHHMEDILGYTVYHTASDELNIGHARSGETVTVQGIELETRSRIHARVELFLNYAYQDAEYDGPADQEFDWPQPPRHKLSAGVRYRGPVVVDLRGRHVGDALFDEVPTEPVDAYTTVDAAISRRQGPVTVKLAATNLLDDRHHEYPLYTELARRVMATIRYDF